MDGWVGGVSGLEQHHSQTVSDHLKNVPQFTFSEYTVICWILLSHGGDCEQHYILVHDAV
jgi:hypothetical protein